MVSLNLSLIVSLKLPMSRLKTSNPKKDDHVIFTHEEPPNQDNVRRRQRDYVYYPGNEEFQEGGVRVKPEVCSSC